jgi:hypothetical protein
MINAVAIMYASYDASFSRFRHDFESHQAWMARYPAFAAMLSMSVNATLAAARAR